MAEARRRTLQADHVLSSFVGGLLLGGLIGAGAMWLLAPRAGRRTRWQIQQMNRNSRMLEEGAAQVRAKDRKVTTGSHGENEAAKQGDESERLFREEALMVWGDEGGAIR